MQGICLLIYTSSVSLLRSIDIISCCIHLFFVIFMNLLIINAGSSSVKFGVYSLSDNSCIFHKTIDRLSDVREGIKQIPEILQANNLNKIFAIGHRVVHGGLEFLNPVLINEQILAKLRKLEPLAPLHQPYNLQAIEIFLKIMPGTPQIACFDTAFHASQPKLNKTFPLPHKFYDEGIIRYGFHGLSYQYIASKLPEYCGKNANKNVIVTHLGNGASMCAMQNLQSIASTMGFSTLEGLMMGTRTGSIDPGLLLYLMDNKNYTSKDLEQLLYKESGLAGVAGMNSSDMRDIISNPSDNAKLALEMFCQIAARHIASLAVCIGGIDIIVFTAGIGENSPIVRAKICNHLKWIGIEINNIENKKNSTKISSVDSIADVYVIPTNEDLSIIDGVKSIL